MTVRLVQGEVRMVCIAKEKKTYFTLGAAAEELGPALKAADSKIFSATKFKVRAYAARQTDAVSPAPQQDCWRARRTAPL